MAESDRDMQREKNRLRMAAWRERVRLNPQENAKYLAHRRAYMKLPHVKERVNKYKKKFAKTPKGMAQLRQSQRRVRMKRKGITLAIYDQLMEQQMFSCGICGTTMARRDDEKALFAVDHCHRSGKVRGLLCWKCNSMIGRLNDSEVEIAIWADSAIRYLKKPPMEKLKT